MKKIKVMLSGLGVDPGKNVFCSATSQNSTTLFVLLFFLRNGRSFCIISHKKKKIALQEANCSKHKLQMVKNKSKASSFRGQSR